MIEVGRICVKIAGRDAGKKCVVVDTMEGNFVLIDGETRRRKCNIAHLEPTKTVIKLSKGADHSTVSKEFEKLDIKLVDSKPKQKTERPRQVRKVKAPTPVKETKKAEPKKEAPKKEPVQTKPQD